jgi:hypothetical protein
VQFVRDYGRQVTLSSGLVKSVPTPVCKDEIKIYIHIYYSCNYDNGRKEGLKAKILCAVTLSTSGDTGPAEALVNLGSSHFS